MNIFTEVKNLMTSYKSESIYLTENNKFSQHKTIERIRAYRNDEFYQNVGNDDIFWNLGKPRELLVAKNIDNDTKDFKPIGLGEINQMQAFILNQKYKAWAKNSMFALTLNNIAVRTASYGSSIWKKEKKGVKVTLKPVNLSNVVFDPTVENIEDAGIFIEKHYLSAYELQKKKGIWDNVQKLIDSGNTEDDEHPANESDKKKDSFTILEVWAEQEVDDKWEYKHYFISEEYDIILFEEDSVKTKFPYNDFHFGDYDGRWMRIGLYEKLFRLQERVNSLVNENAMATKIASLVLFRTQDQDTFGNLLNALRSGDIINSSDLQQIPMDNRAVNSFISELQLIEQQADKLVNTPNVISGEKTPSGTPFRSLAVLTNAAKSTFRFIRQGIGEKMSKIMTDDIFPALVSNWNKGEIIDISQDREDIAAFDKMMFLHILTKWIKERGKPVSQEEMLQLDEQVKEELDRTGRKMKITKNFFDFKFGIELQVTGETVDKGQQNDAYFNAIQFTMQSPDIQNNPLFKQYLENNNIPPYKVPEMVQEQPQGEAKPIQGKQDKLLAQVDSE